MIDIVSATRCSELDFWNETALGLSLIRLANDKRLCPKIAYENERGLPLVYNEAILSDTGSDYIVFIHDDIWIDDYFIAQRIIDGLQRFDIIGVAGNINRTQNQPAWCFVGKKLEWDVPENLSGAIAWGEKPFGPVCHYGETPMECELLDGVFLAAKKQLLIKLDVQFDPIFDFHFYDMDFCRRANFQGMRLGTWPISLTHQSRGAFGTPHWADKYKMYLKKWGS